jgi:hypothetical protein
MDILVIVSLMVVIIALVAGVSSFRYLTDEIRRQEALINENAIILRETKSVCKRLELLISEQAVILNELKSVWKMLDVLAKMQIATPKPEPVKETKQESKQEIPKPPKRLRAESAEMNTVWGVLNDIE